MKLNLITLAVLLIVPDLTLLFLPQPLLLFSWQVSSRYCACFNFFLYFFWRRNFLVSLDFFVASLGYFHYSALSLLQQAQNITAQKTSGNF